MIKEILFKNWKRETAEKLGIKVHALEQRLSAGTHPYPPVRRQRVSGGEIYVLIKEPRR